MKYHYFFIAILITIGVKAQNKSEITAASETPTALAPAFTSKGTKDPVSSKGFLDFYIPSAILAYGIEPASVSKVTIALADTKFSLKYGFGLGKSGKGTLQRAIGFQFGSKAIDGVKSILGNDKIPRDFTLSVIYTEVLKDILYVKDISQPETNREYTSNWAQWLNTTLNANVSQKYVFSGDTVYAEYNNVNFQFMVSFTNYFNSLYGNYKKGRNILSGGIGIGGFDNYTDLTDYTLRKSVINVNNNYIGESKTIIGKKGKFERFTGMIGSLSAFYPFSKPTSLTTFTIGANANAFGIGSDNMITNANGGFYVSKRSFDDDDALKEDFSFGVLAVFGNLQNTSVTNYYKNNFTVVLTAQIPISFK